MATIHSNEQLMVGADPEFLVINPEHAHALGKSSKNAPFTDLQIIYLLFLITFDGDRKYIIFIDFDT